MKSREPSVFIGIFKVISLINETGNFPLFTYFNLEAPKIHPFPEDSFRGRMTAQEYGITLPSPIGQFQPRFLPSLSDAREDPLETVLGYCRRTSALYSYLRMFVPTATRSAVRWLWPRPSGDGERDAPAQPRPGSPSLLFLDPEKKIRPLAELSEREKVCHVGRLPHLARSELLVSTWHGGRLYRDGERAKVIIDHHRSDRDLPGTYFLDSEAEATGKLVFEALRCPVCRCLRRRRSL